MEVCVFSTAANLLSAFADVDEDACGGMFVKVNKKSGKVFFLRSRRKKDVSKKAFEIALERIKQLGEDGKPVGKPIESLANQDFNISRLDRSAKLGNLNAAKLDIKAFLKDPQAYVRIELYILCQGGKVTFGDDEIELKNGSMKFYVTVCRFTNDLLHVLNIKCKRSYNCFPLSQTQSVLQQT